MYQGKFERTMTERVITGAWFSISLSKDVIVLIIDISRVASRVTRSSGICNIDLKISSLRIVKFTLCSLQRLELILVGLGFAG